MLCKLQIYELEVTQLVVTAMSLGGSKKQLYIFHLHLPIVANSVNIDHFTSSPSAAGWANYLPYIIVVIWVGFIKQHLWWLFIFTLRGLTSRKTHRGGLGLGGSVHEEAHPCFVQPSFKGIDFGSIYHPLVQLIPSINHSVWKPGLNPPLAATKL